MHEVARVLGSLLLSTTPLKQLSAVGSTLLPSTKIASYMDEYANLKTLHLVNCSAMSTSDAQLFREFGEVISHNSNLDLEKSA